MPSRTHRFFGMEAAPSNSKSTRIAWLLAIGWTLAAIAWMVLLALSFLGKPVPLDLLALFAAGSVAMLSLLALWKRTREVWKAWKSERTSEIFVSLTILGVLVVLMLTLELSALIFIWMVQTGVPARLRTNIFWVFPAVGLALWVGYFFLRLKRRFGIPR